MCNGILRGVSTRPQNTQFAMIRARIWAVNRPRVRAFPYLGHIPQSLHKQRKAHPPLAGKAGFSNR